MPSNRLTLLDAAKLNASDKVVGLIEEVVTEAPEFTVLPVRTIKGTSYKTVLRTGLPSVGFRKVNQGVDAAKSTFETKLVECYPLAGRVEVDKAASLAYEDGEAAYEAIESAGVMKQSLIEIGSQVFYGTSVDANGFPGLIAMVDSSMVLDAGGTTAGTGSSVWGVKYGPQDLQLILGGGMVLDLGAFRDETIYDAASKPLPGRVADLIGWIGLQCVSRYSVSRLKDATADSGKGVTDAKLSELLSKAPVGRKPDAWFMTRRSAFQLQSSRSATTNATGAKSGTGREVFAPMPTESCGIPIVVTDSLTDTETLS